LIGMAPASSWDGERGIGVAAANDKFAFFCEAGAILRV
jgi:hypothetical protein